LLRLVQPVRGAAEKPDRTSGAYPPHEAGFVGAPDPPHGAGFVGPLMRPVVSQLRGGPFPRAISHPTKSAISRGPRVSHPTKSAISRGPRVSHPTKSAISRGPRVSGPAAFRPPGPPMPRPGFRPHL